MTSPTTVLVVGSTGSVGRHVVAESVRQGYRTRALVRRGASTRGLDAAAEQIVGDLTDASTLGAALDGVDAVVFTQGAAYGNASGAEAVDYGAVRNILRAAGGRPLRIALMTSIGVTRRSATHDWKRRGERLIRASGNAYTIVRPGWFDYNDASQREITLLQGDTRHAGSPADGVIARADIARVLVDSLASDAAAGTTFELVASHGPGQSDLEPVFAALDRDAADSLDAVRDQANLPLTGEPFGVRADLDDVALRVTR